MLKVSFAYAESIVRRMIPYKRESPNFIGIYKEIFWLN